PRQATTAFHDATRTGRAMGTARTVRQAMAAGLWPSTPSAFYGMRAGRRAQEDTAKHSTSSGMFASQPDSAALTSLDAPSIPVALPSVSVELAVPSMIVSPPTPVSSLSLPPASPGGGNLELLHMRFHVGAQAQPGDFLGTEVKRSHPG